MNLVFKRSLFAVAVLSLTACGHAPKDPESIYDRAPENVYIEVIFDAEGCPIETQTFEKSCPFLDDRDPRDLACQEPSPRNNARRKIVWQGAQDFTIVFKEDTPFKGDTGHCKISSAAQEFTCLLRKETEKPPLRGDYKYDVVAEATGCPLDPWIYLMR